MPPFHVLGAGSIGSVFAHHLARNGHPVTLLLRSSAKLNRLQALDSSLTVESRGPQGTSIESSRVTGEHATSSSSSAIQNLLVVTKANHALAALQSVHHRLGPSSVVVLLQNGVLGVYQELVLELFSEPSSRPVFLLGTTTHGAHRKQDFHAIHVGHGTCQFGLPEDLADTDLLTPAEGRSAQPAAAAASSSSSTAEGVRRGAEADHQQQRGSSSSSASTSSSKHQPPGTAATAQSHHHHARPPPSSSHPLTAEQQQRTAGVLAALGGLQALCPDTSLSPQQLRQQLLRKLVINCCANPLTALLHCKNGGLINNPPAHQLMQQVVAECKAVFGEQLLGSEGELLDMVEHVVGFNTHNYNSMLQDVVHGVYTEVEYLNGYVVRQGQQAGVACPINQLLCQLVKAREAVAPDMRTAEHMAQHSPA